MDFEQAKVDYQAERFEAALTALKPLAEQGHAEAQSMLASLYQLGLGTAIDRVEAERWYRAASAQGSAVASNNLAELLEVDGRVDEAREFYELSLQQGFAHAKTTSP